MDRPRREVLRRKRPIIADILDFSVTSQREYKQLGLLLDEMMPEIRAERSEFGRVFKWLELLPMRGPEAFDHLTALIRSRGHTWLCNEMLADLDYEDGSMHVEEYIYREAGMLVHKVWGKSKRISEVEKREIQRLISGRYQTAKEGYKRQIQEIQHRLDDVTTTKSLATGKMKDLVMRMHAYLRVERDRQNSTVPELENIIGLVQNHMEEKSKELNNEKSEEEVEEDYYEVFTHALDAALELLSKTLNEKEEIEKERQKIIDTICEQLGIDKDQLLGSDIGSMLKEMMDKHEDALEQAKKELEEKNEAAKNTEDQLNQIKEEMDKNLSEKEENIIRLEGEILDKIAEVADLKKHALDMTEERESWQEEAERWRARAEELERTRRMGYYIGPYEKRYYNVNSYTAKRKPSTRWQKSDKEVQGREKMTKASSLDSFSYRMMLEDDEETAKRFYYNKMMDKEKEIEKKRPKGKGSSEGSVQDNESRASDDTSFLDSTLTPPLEHGKYLVEMGPGSQQSSQNQTKNNKQAFPSKSDHELERTQTFIKEERRRLKTRGSEEKMMLRSESFFWDDNYQTKDGVLMKGEAKKLKRKSSDKKTNVNNTHPKQIKESGNSKSHVDVSKGNADPPKSNADASKGNVDASKGNADVPKPESSKGKEGNKVSDGSKSKEQKGSGGVSTSSISSTRTGGKKGASPSKSGATTKHEIPDHGQDSPYHDAPFCVICNQNLAKPRPSTQQHQ